MEVLFFNDDYLVRTTNVLMNCHDILSVEANPPGVFRIVPCLEGQ